MPKPKKFDVVVVGELFVDEILSGLQAMPGLGEEAFARKYAPEAGGGAAITACGLAKLGASVAVLGVIGEDGNWLRDRLQENGVDTSHVKLHGEEPTGLTVSVSTREDRAFFSYSEANDALNPLVRSREWTEVMRSARMVHIATSPDRDLDRRLIPMLKRAGVLVSLDVQSHTSWLTSPTNLKILRAVDLFCPNESEAEWVAGETGIHPVLRGLRAKGLNRVVVKLGGKGAALTWDDAEYFIDAFDVATEDTTGAGDCFNAGFLYGLLRGEELESCLNWGNICGALSTRELGGLRGFPSRSELQKSARKRTKPQRGPR